jgi:hypothetical protein
MAAAGTPAQAKPPGSSVDLDKRALQMERTLFFDFNKLGAQASWLLPHGYKRFAFRSTRFALRVATSGP